MNGSTLTTTGNKLLEMRKLGDQVSVGPLIVATAPKVSIRLLAGSLRRSYQPANRCVPSGGTARVGKNWSLLVASSLTRAGADQVAPPSTDCTSSTSPRSADEALSV